MKQDTLRIIFMGTPDFAVASLEALLAGRHQVVGVVTMPDKAIGRHHDVLQASPVKECALKHGIPVLQPEKLRDEDFLAQLRSLQADLQVVVAFRMLPEVVWAMPRFGTFNVHAALLPQYRGAAPINWAVINGETVTGVTTFFLDHDIDTGRIITQREFPIPDDADVEYVYDGLMHLGAEICKDTVDMVLTTDGNVPSQPQDDTKELHHAPKIFKETCEIKWDSNAKQIYDFVRGLSPYPGVWTTLAPIDAADGAASVLKVYGTAKTEQSCGQAAPGTLRTEHGRLFVATADKWLEITQLQAAGKKRMAARDFLNGFKAVEKFVVK